MPARLKNLIGKKYGRLTIIRDAKNRRNRRMVRCKCKCGTIKSYELSCVRSGNTKSCGCIRRLPKINVGQKFGKWTVINAKPNKKYRIECQCTCGRKGLIYPSSLLTKHTTQCGYCRMIHMVSFITKHHKSDTKVHIAWMGMRRRCYNKKDKSYQYYGGRGIKVCKRWHIFLNFYADIGEPPTLKHSIDRINNDGDYKPSNCRWATHSEQMHNRRYPKHRVTH